MGNAGSEIGNAAEVRGKKEVLICGSDVGVKSYILKGKTFLFL